jgi:hypothetical protein
MLKVLKMHTKKRLRKTIVFSGEQIENLSILKKRKFEVVVCLEDLDFRT